MIAAASEPQTSKDLTILFELNPRPSLYAIEDQPQLESKKPETAISYLITEKRVKQEHLGTKLKVGTKSRADAAPGISPFAGYAMLLTSAVI